MRILHNLLLIFAIVLIFASIGEGIFGPSDGGPSATANSPFGFDKLLNKLDKSGPFPFLKSAMLPFTQETTIKPPKPKNKVESLKSKKGSKVKDKSEESSTSDEETSGEDEEDTIPAREIVSASEFFTTTTLPITGTPPPSPLTQQPTSTKKSKKRRKSKSKRKFFNTTDLSTDSRENNSSSEYSDEDIKLPTAEPSTPTTSQTSSTITSVPKSTTEAASQVSSATDVGLVKKSLVSPSTATIPSAGSTEPMEKTEAPISSLSSPEAFNSSQVQSTTKKPDNVTSSKEPQAKPKFMIMPGKTLSVSETEDSSQDEVASQTESSDDKASQQCVATVPRLNLHLDMMLGEWYPVRISETTSKLWSQSLEKQHNNSKSGCFLMNYKMPKDDPDTLQITLSRQEESAQVEALFVGDDHHPKESKWAITWPNGEDTLTSVVAAGVILGVGGGGKGKDAGERRNSSSSRYTWLLTVDCDLNGIVEPDWAVMARVPEGISNATLSTILAIVEGLKGLTVDDAITYQSDDCHKNNNNTNKKLK